MSITLLPTPPSRQDPNNFAVRADAFLGALPTFGTEANALANTVNGYQLTAGLAASNASASATAAATSATAAANSATSAAASFDSFDDRYLGAKTANPTLDNDGNALLVGALYWHSTALEMRVWNGTAWVAVQTTTAATNAANSATAASNSATAAAASATSAGTSATAAATSATSAATSATSAAASLDSFDDRYLGAKTLNPFEDNDTNPLLAGALYWNSTASEMRVWNGTAWVAVQTTSAATNAANSATAASNSATAAAASATSAATSATNAGTSATNAANSATAAAASLDSFDDRYLGAKTANPTLDNDGDPLINGALYWNSGNLEMRVWNGTAWVAVQTTSAATAAATSATAASNSATAAAASATSAAASLDSFDDRYLGAKTADPFVDNDGDALLVGALYYNSTALAMRVYNGSGWIAVQTTTAATNAAASATAAAASATAASTSATNSANSATAAAASATSATASFDSFDDRYLGLKTANPTVDNDGDALLVGAIYWNSTSSEMRVWNGTAWVAIQTTSAATNAAASATAAAASATSAGTSATNAAASATSAAASLDSFDDRYLGAKTANPALDNDGDALLSGALYWNSTALEMRVWNGTAWVAVQTTSAATNAAASATAAATNATSASTSATAASNSATSSATSATNSATSASNAANSATAAANSAAAAAATFDSFDDRYLGPKSAPPGLDNDGNALLSGALYWNTSNNTLFIWTGTAWSVPTAGVSTFNGRNGVVSLTSADVVNVLDSGSNFTAGIINATDFNSTSDQELKTNVSSIDPGLLAGILPVSFEWKATGEKSYGVIAQQLQQTMPELVHSRPDGLLGVSYTPIIALLVQAVKDLQDKVKMLESR